MAVLPVRVFPDQVLKEKAAPVERATAEVSALVDDLIDTMRNAPGGVGIAAPQAGALLRIIVVDVSAHRRGSREPNHGLLVLLNPEILAMGGQQVVREGCMSVPEYTANVRRAEWVLVDALDRHGERTIIEAVGFEAVAIQHEMDHLDGILFLDRVASVKNDLFRRKKHRY